MMPSLGQTRSHIGPRHALIAPDSHEAVTLPDWPGATLVHLVTPDMGSGFSLFLVRTEGGLNAAAPAAGVERFVLLREGAAVLALESGEETLAPDDYAVLPAGCLHRITAEGAAVLLVLERRYTPRAGVEPSAVYRAKIGDIPSAPLKGDTRLQVQKLLPQGPEWDMEINTMTFEPGASLPYVETHFMEHGLVMLDGGGIYRLEDAWYPVRAGDAIWMGPYCPQWFGAIGTGNARYLIYKNWNRDPLEKTQRL